MLIYLQSGPPYLSPAAMPGMTPTASTDIPVAAVLIVFFVAFFVTNIVILRQNNRNGTPFRLTILLIVYSVFRTAALSLRIAYAEVQSDANLTIAANVLANAGAIMLIILNLLMMPRLMGAFFGPSRMAAGGWRKKVATLPFMIPIPLVPIMLLMTINVVILTFFTTDATVRQNCLTVQKVALTVLAVVAFVPVVPSFIVALLGSSTSAVKARSSGFAGMLARKTLNPVPGTGSVRTNALLMLFGSSVLTLGAAIRAATLLSPARPADDPAWYHERGTYYIFTYAVEILVVGAYLIFRLDRRFQTPKPEATESLAEEGKAVETFPDQASREETISEEAQDAYEETRLEKERPGRVDQGE